MRILGIDPGLATMGWGVIESDGYKEKLVQYGALLTYPRDSFPTRLQSLMFGVRSLLQTFKPVVIAFQQFFFSMNVLIQSKHLNILFVKIIFAFLRLRSIPKASLIKSASS